MDFELIEKALPILLLGAGVTIEITAVSVFIGFCIGLFVGIARICKVKVLRILAAIYADCIRGTPLLVQIFLIYFALPIVTGLHRPWKPAALRVWALSSMPRAVLSASTSTTACMTGSVTRGWKHG